MDGPAPRGCLRLNTSYGRPRPTWMSSSKYHAGRLQSAIRSHVDPDGFREAASNHLALSKERCVRRTLPPLGPATEHAIKL
jgi:hypothetical protein